MLTSGKHWAFNEIELIGKIKNINFSNFLLGPPKFSNGETEIIDQML